jgi:hypothetical protein
MLIAGIQMEMRGTGAINFVALLKMILLLTSTSLQNGEKSRSNIFYCFIALIFTYASSLLCHIYHPEVLNTSPYIHISHPVRN